MSMRKKIEAAILDELSDRSGVIDGIDDDIIAEIGEACAAAVLDALMEPTDDMQEMGDHAYNLTGVSGASGFPATSEEHTAFIWQAMIQAAKDGK